MLIDKPQDKDMISRYINYVAVSNQSLTQPDAKQLYFALHQSQPQANTLAQSQQFLQQQLNKVKLLPTDLPSDIEALMDWVHANTLSVGKQYQDYLTGRQNADAPRYFPTKSHALHFLKGVAPTKLVDGAWLYGLVKHWPDTRYGELIKTYLEELGDGEADKNHVVLYQKLLVAHDCSHWQDLPQANFVQGAIQLSLAHHATEFLPEIIGFNLGYEQLPLHLLICAYELAEWDIDPYYFTLHMTIDNADTGHAARAVKAVIDALPQLGDKDIFYQRVQNGYQLNSLGASTTSIIADFDLEQEVLRILSTKAVTGAQLHSDYCRIDGKTVNDWLANPAQIPAFMDTLVDKGWIRRHEPPSNSRFWNLLAGEKGAMFGVFDAYELQVIFDWIAGDNVQAPTSMNRRYKYRRQGFDSPAKHGSESNYCGNESSAEAKLLIAQLNQAPDKKAEMEVLIPWLSPTAHHTPLGLLATRLFAQKLWG